MEKHQIRNLFFGLLTVALLAGPAQDVLAQRTDLHATRRNNEQRVSRPSVKKDKERKQSIRKDQRRKDVREKPAYQKKESRNHKQEYRQSKKDRSHYQRTSWRTKHYRKPVWADYRRHGYYHPRIGARFSVLPRGFISFWIGGARYYTYHGIYYRYDPGRRVYFVIEKPAIKTMYTSTQWDRITLLDGSTIEGVYLGGDDTVVQFEVGDAVLEIPMSEIKVLSFSEH